MSTGTTPGRIGGGVDNDPLPSSKPVWRLYRRGERDLLDSGVAPVRSRAARHRPKDCRRLLNRICDEGVVIKLDGAKPTNYAGRTSYAPSVLYNGGEGSDDARTPTPHLGSTAHELNANLNSGARPLGHNGSVLGAL